MKLKKNPAADGRVLQMPVEAIHPSPENDMLYRPVKLTDPEIKNLAANVRKRGVLQPLVISLDNYIVSGHRRHAAARLAGLKTVPCIVESIRRTDPEFLQHLAQPQPPAGQNRRRDPARRTG